MDEETRNEIETLRKQIVAVAGCVGTLQLLANQHANALTTIAEILEDKPHVHPAP